MPCKVSAADVDINFDKLQNKEAIVHYFIVICTFLPGFDRFQTSVSLILWSSCVCTQLLRSQLRVRLRSLGCALWAALHRVRWPLVSCRPGRVSISLV